MSRSQVLGALVAVTAVGFAASLALLDSRYCGGFRFEESSGRIVNIDCETDETLLLIQVAAGVGFGLALVGAALHVGRRWKFGRRLGERQGL